MPPNPPRALPDAEEDKEFSETKELLKQMHAQYTELLGENPFKGASPRLKKKKKRLTLMETILQIKSVSLVAKWGIFAGNVLPSRDNKPCQYRLKPTLQRHLAPDARKGIIGQKTIDLNSIRMGLHLPTKYKEVIFPSFRETGSRDSPDPRQQQEQSR